MVIHLLLHVFVPRQKEFPYIYTYRFEKTLCNGSKLKKLMAAQDRKKNNILGRRSFKADIFEVLIDTSR